MKKEEFKEFVRKNPSLIKYVKNNEMTWQKFYEMYDLYGEDNSVWNEYIANNNIVKNTNPSGALLLSDVVKWFKNVDLDSVEESIGNVQRVLDVVKKKKKKESKDVNYKSYRPRPLYRHFED